MIEESMKNSRERKDLTKFKQKFMKAMLRILVLSLNGKLLNKSMIVKNFLKKSKSKSQNANRSSIRKIR